MKMNPHSTTRSLVLAALFLALAFVLPMITGHVPQVGNMLCPMHFPILLCGFVLGGPWGLAVGFIASAGAVGAVRHAAECSPSPSPWPLSWPPTALCPACSGTR